MLELRVGKKYDGLSRLMRWSRSGGRKPRRGSCVPACLRDAVADVVDGVVARHLLLQQEIGGTAFALG
jgi:hypothetical protein